MNGRKNRGLLKGLLLGAGLGILFAPKKGSETRKDLTDKISDLKKKINDLEAEEVKQTISKKLDDLKKELDDLDGEKLEALTRAQATKIKNKAEELYNLAVEKGTPVLQKAADDVLQTTINLLQSSATKLEKAKSTNKPKETKK